MNFESKKDYDIFLESLIKKTDSTYKEFHGKLLKDNNLIGIRVPDLKKIAKEISKNNYKGFIKYTNHNYYEEKTIHGLLLGYLKISEEELFKLIDEFLPYNDNWATNDITCANLKIFKKIPFDKVLNYVNSKDPWTIRFGLVLLLNYYINDENIDKILRICDNVKSEEYYVQMANAWLISICFIKYQKKTYDFLLNNNLDKFTFNKSISKICDSYRVDKGTKEKLKKIKGDLKCMM